MNKTTLAALALAAGLGLATTSAQATDVEVILPLTGPGAFLGKAQQTALMRLEQAIKDRVIKEAPVHFVFHDDQTVPQNGVQLLNELKAKSPPVIIGASLVAVCNAMTPLVKNGPVVYCLSPGIHPPVGGYMFTSGVNTVDLAASMIRYWRLKGIKRLGLITSTDASGQDAERNIRAIVALPENKDAGVEIVGDGRFNPGDVSVTAQIERIKETNPQALIAWSTGGPIATVFKAISATGLDVPVATTNGNMTYAQMDQYADFLPKDLYIPSSSWMTEKPGTPLEAAHLPFRKLYDDAHDAPDSASTLGWDPALLVVHVLSELGPNATAEQVHQKLLETKGFTGVNGTYDFSASPQRGLTEDAVIVTKWDRTKHAWVPVSGPHGLAE
jgi:branched-chain amino acid transport system substrate-binding protein